MHMWCNAHVVQVRSWGCPLLVTSYNLDEAEDDEEALQAFGLDPTFWRWPPQHNPWRSLENERGVRLQSSTEAPALCENAVWQCL